MGSPTPTPGADAPAGRRAEAAAGGSAPADLVAVESIAVQPDRLVLEVQLAAHAPRSMDAQLAERLDRMRPTLKMHACVNGTGPFFGHVMATTSIPHVLEHLILDEQVRAEGAPDAFPFSGITLWLDEGAGRAHIEVSYFDDLTALEAVRTATMCLNDLLRG